MSGLPSEWRMRTELPDDCVAPLSSLLCLGGDGRCTEEPVCCVVDDEGRFTGIAICRNEAHAAEVLREDWL